MIGEAYVRIRASSAGLTEEASSAGSKAGAAFSAAFNRHSKGAFSGVESELGRASRGAAAGSGAFQHLGRSLAFASGTFLGTASAVKLVTDSLSKAADAQKEYERAQSLFLAGAKDVEKFAKGAANSLGLAADQALKMSNDLGQMLVPLGVAPKHAADLSVQLVKLVGNLASMRNEDPSTTLQAIETGLRGRGMALKNYGIVVDNTTLKAEALRLGLVKTSVDLQKVQVAQDKLNVATAVAAKAQADYGANSTQYVTARDRIAAAEAALTKAVGGSVPALTQQQKSLAATNLILDQGKRYSDEFAKHSGDLANVEKRLHAEISNTEVAIGEALLPTMTKVTAAVADWLGKAENQARIQRDVTKAVHDAGVAFGVAWDVIKTGVAIIRPVVGAVGGLKSALELLLAVKVGFWVTGTVVPAMQRAQAAWKDTGTAAKTAAEDTTAATTVIKADVASVGTAAQTANAKVSGSSGLVGGLGKLKSIGKIAIPIAVITTVTNSGGSPWSAAIQGGMLGLLFGGPEGAVAGAVAAATLNIVVNYIRGSGSPSDPGPPLSTSGPAKVPIVQAQGNSRNVGYIRNVAREMWTSGESRETIYNALVAAGYDPGIVAQAIIDATNDDQLNAARQKVIARNKRAAAAAAASGGGGTVPDKNILSTPTTDTHGARLLPAFGQMGTRNLDWSAKAGTIVGAPEAGYVHHLSGHPFTGSAGSGAYGLSLYFVGTDTGDIYFMTHFAKIIAAVGVQLRRGDPLGVVAFDHIHIELAPGGYVLPGSGAQSSVTASAVGGSGSGSASGSTAPLTVGTKPPKPPKPLFEPVSQTLSNQLAAAQRRVTAAGTIGGTTLEAAINAEIAVDKKLIEAARKAKTSTAAQKREVASFINQRKDDITTLKARLAAVRKQEEAAQEREGARLEAHDTLVDVYLAALGIPKGGGSSRAADTVRAAAEAMSNAALRAATSAINKAKATVGRLIKQAQSGEAAGKDIIGSLLGMDPKTIIQFTDRWGRVISETVGQVTAKAQKAMDELAAAIASHNPARIAKAIAAWKGLGSEISQAVSESVQAHQGAFETAFDRLANRIDTAFNRETQRNLTAMQKAASDRITAMQKVMNDQIAAIQKAAAQLTPAEAALKRLQDQHNALQRNLAQGDAQQQLSDAQKLFQQLSSLGVGGVNPATGQPVTQADIQAASDAMVQAQRALDDALFTQQEASLQKRADSERADLDQRTQDKIEAIQRDEAIQEDAVQREEAKREQDYQDQRDAQQQALDDQLADWKKHLEDGSAKWSDFVSWLKGEGATGDFGPDPVVGMTDAGQAQGSAFAEAYIAELERAYKAQQALLNGDDPAAAAGPAPKAHPTGFGKGPQGFALGGQIPGFNRGFDDRFALVQPGETVIDRTLTNALKQVFVGNGSGGFNKDAVELLYGLLVEARKHTGLLSDQPGSAVGGPNPNRIALKAMR